MPDFVATRAAWVDDLLAGEFPLIWETATAGPG